MKQKTCIVYIGLTRNGNPFLATTANGFNNIKRPLRAEFRVRLDNLPRKQQKGYVKSLRYLADRLERKLYDLV